MYSNRFVRPVRLVKIKRILLSLTIAGDESLVVQSVRAALMPRADGKIEHRPDERAQINGRSFHRRPGGFVELRLPFFRMPLAIRLGLFGILFMLPDIGTRTIFADGKNRQSGSCGRYLSSNAPKFSFGPPSRIPAGINVPAKQVGDFVHLGKLISARGTDRRARRILAVGKIVQILQFSVRIGDVPVEPDFIEQAPCKNGGMIDILPDQVQQLVPRRFLKLQCWIDFVDPAEFPPRPKCLPGRTSCKNNRCADNARSARPSRQFP